MSKALVVWGVVTKGTPAEPEEIRILKQTDPGDRFAKPPAEYLEAVERGINISFLSDDEVLMALAAPEKPAKGKPKGDGEAKPEGGDGQ